MLRSMKELFGYSVAATDGPIGKVEDFLFDERTHEIRYLVVDTGGWLDRRPVLVAPVAFGRPRWPARDFPIRSTRDQVKASPGLVADAPLSRQHEADVHSHYEWMPYWLTHGHGHGTPTAHVADASAPLCRAREVMGYQIRATDDEFGHISDFIIDESQWRVAFVVVDTEHWWPPRMVMVDMVSFHGVDAAGEQAIIGLPERLIRESPVYDPAAVANHEHEMVLYDYLGRPRL